MLIALAVILASYILGSIPSGHLAGRLARVDVRKSGSGNIGATNVLRVLGRRWGFTVFAIDALKGFLAVRLALWMVAETPRAEYDDFYAILAATASVVGHSFPIWLRFKGGKGVATSAGALFGAMPVAALAILLVWIAIFLATRYVSVASMFAAVSLPLVVGVLVWSGRTHGVILFYFSLAMACLVVWRHRSNISRLRAGTEQRFSRK